MSEDIIYLDDRALKRVELVDRVQLVVAAGALLLSSVERLRQPEARDLVLAALQALTSLAVVAFVVAWVRKRHVPSAARVGWVDLMAGLMLLVEWGDRVVHGGKLLSPVFVQAGVFIALALLHTRVTARRQRGRYVRVDDNGISVRRSLVRRWRIAWSDVASVSREPRAVCIKRQDGRARRIGLGRLENGDEVARFILDHAEAMGVRADDLGDQPRAERETAEVVGAGTLPDLGSSDTSIAPE